MPNENDSQTVVLAHVANEWHATLIADVLRDHQIDAEVAGALTSQFRAEAPGLVRVIVPSTQIERARAVLDEHREAVTDIDWSQVDLGSPES